MTYHDEYDQRIDERAQGSGQGGGMEIYDEGPLLLLDASLVYQLQQL